MIYPFEVEILLVEDNSSDIELTLRAFKKHNITNKVHVVRDGAEALDFIFAKGNYAERNINNIPKVILLDLKLPKFDGIEVLRRVKSDERTKVIPVIILTSSKEETDKVKSYTLGANSYITKPVDFDKFAKIVSEIGYYWMLVNQSPK
jgi:two-component system response regulator